MYSTAYGKSKALVIGIDKYLHASPLHYAVSDARAVSELLINNLGFQKEDVYVLTDDAASRAAIFKAFLAFANSDTQSDDRIIIFFAGHGHTVSSLRGEVGYLIPSDGEAGDLSTLLRWDDLTRNADLIPAKHILFVMDACYGGLAVTRSFRPGAMRFLKDMMQRPARQVLTSGKGNEPVSDSGGPLPDHSVFTGHLIEALSGKAEDNLGNLTANGVIAYVYQAVSADTTSQQTPHYGYIHGDGDMIFYPIPTAHEEQSEAERDERLVSVPVLIAGKEAQVDQQSQIKELLSETKYRILLFDYMAQRTREVLSLTGDDYFAVSGNFSNEKYVERLHKYEEAVQGALQDEMLLGRWGELEHLEAMKMPLKRLAERIAPMSGTTYLLESRWYPNFLLMCAGCIGAIAGSNYKALYNLLYTPVSNPHRNANAGILLVASFKAMGAIHDGFKLIPGHERQYTPRSEYLYKLLQPIADDVLLTGAEYEDIFDRCEIFFALEYMHVDHPAAFTDGEYCWSPLGRFAWKYESPLKRLIIEVNAAGDSWPPLQAGLFGQSRSRFLELTKSLSILMTKTGWY